MIKLYHRKNEIAVDLSGVNNPRAITIVYVGKFHGESMLPDDWQFFANRSKITCLSFSQNSSIPELLFNYTGLIHIKGGTVIDADLEKHSFHVSLEDIDYWETSTGKFSTNTQYWDGLDSTHDRGGDISRTSIVKKNLLTNDGEFFFKDGTPYNGEYHQHQDSQALSGAAHTEESEFIYRKSGNGVIYNPRKRLSVKEKLEILKTKSIHIPKTSKFSKEQPKEISIKQPKGIKVAPTPKIVTAKKTPKLKPSKGGY